MDFNWVLQETTVEMECRLTRPDCILQIHVGAKWSMFLGNEMEKESSEVEIMIWVDVDKTRSRMAHLILHERMSIVSENVYIYIMKNMEICLDILAEFRLQMHFLVAWVLKFTILAMWRH